jgi:hypothetical protein
MQHYEENPPQLLVGAAAIAALLFGLAMLLVIAAVLPIRLGFEISSRTHFLPSSGCNAPPMRASGDDDRTFAMWPGLMCNATGITIARGEPVRIEIALPQACPDESDTNPLTRRTSTWADATIPVTTPAGFSTSTRVKESWGGLIFLAAMPFRRILYADWYVPIASIDRYLPERHPLMSDVTTFTAGRDGELTLYVNDAIVPFPRRDTLYKNNAGGPARVRVTRGAAATAVPTPTAAPAAGAIRPYDCVAQRALREDLHRVLRDATTSVR